MDKQEEGLDLSGARFSLHMEAQKDTTETMRFLEELPSSFYEEVVHDGMIFSAAQGIQASKICIASFCAKPELVSTNDSPLKKYLLKTGSLISTLRSNELRKVDVLIRNFVKHGYAGILMAIVQKFYPADYQPLVDFINTMPAKPVVEEGGCAVACDGSARNPFLDTLVAIQGLPARCMRESFAPFSGLVHADYNRGQPCGVLRFGTPEEALKAFTTASLPTFQIEGVHPAVHLLTKEECQQYSDEFTAMKLQRKLVRKH
jgi:hypothetical protein